MEKLLCWMEMVPGSSKPSDNIVLLSQFLPNCAFYFILLLFLVLQPSFQINCTLPAQHNTEYKVSSCLANTVEHLLGKQADILSENCRRV